MISQRLSFRLEAEATGSRARAATFRTLHGEVRTPVFMPVGTQATVRSQRVETLADTGSQVLLANTYHLLLRPGPEVFRHVGGIHKFMNWKGSVLTDSGGFQVFSLPHARDMREEGAAFKSYVDGTKILLTPELSIEMQKAIGSDIMMVLDQCIPSTAGRTEALEAMERTHRWAKRSLAARGDSLQSMFGIVQGACFEDLRRQSADFLTGMPFDGFAIGGLAVGETKAEREDFCELTASLLPRNLPRYLMGVGTPIDLLEAVHRGVDMFDCILPTALAQQGVSFTSIGRVDLRRGVYRLADEPLDPGCPCTTCRDYSRAYLHHLIKTKEVLGWTLIGTHNLKFYHRLMSEMRERILADRFVEYYREKRELLIQSDEENPKTHPKKPKTHKAGEKLGRYEVWRSPQGFASIRQIDTGEVMHSVSEPTDEANRLYIDQSALAQRIASGQSLVVWDVGLGAATNAMAAIRAVEAAEKSAGGSLRLVSFENDLDSLRLAIKNSRSFPAVWHPAPKTLLEKGEWSGEGIEWNLYEGDFRDFIDPAASPDIIFFDPFSYKADSELWTPELFARMRARLEGRAVELYTYSASTAVRAALLASGFTVAAGAATGPKSETTIALTPEAIPAAQARGIRLLDSSWLERWERSGARIPKSVPESEVAEFERRIREHPQFALEAEAETVWDTSTATVT